MEWWKRASPITEDSALAPWFSRAQAHHHKIALCCAYYERRTQIEEEDAACAAAVMDYCINSTEALAQVGLLPNRDTQPWIAKSWAETWVIDRVTEQPLSQRRLQQRCYALKDGTAKWVLVKVALDDQLKRGILYVHPSDKEHLLSLAAEPR